MQAQCSGAGALSAVRLYTEGSARAFRVPGALRACGFAFADARGHAGSDTFPDVCRDTKADRRASPCVHTDTGASIDRCIGAKADSDAASHAFCCGRGLGDRRCVGQPCAERCGIGSGCNFHTESDAGGDADGKRGTGSASDTDGKPDADDNPDADGKPDADDKPNADGKPDADGRPDAKGTRAAVGTGVRHWLRDADN